MTPASHDVRALTALYPASCPRPSPSRILSGQSPPSRKRGLLSSANTPNTGTPNPIGRAGLQVEPARRDDPRSPDDALVDVIAKRDVAFGRTAARQDRRVARVEQRLHLLFFVRPGVDVAMGVDESGDGREAARVDGLTGRRRRSGGRRYDSAAAHDDRALSDDGPVADDDPRVRDR